MWFHVTIHLSIRQNKEFDFGSLKKKQEEKADAITSKVLAPTGSRPQTKISSYKCPLLTNCQTSEASRHGQSA